MARPELAENLTLTDYFYPATRYLLLHANEHDDIALVETVNEPSKREYPGTRIQENLSHSRPSFTFSQVILCANNPMKPLRKVPRQFRVAGYDTPLFFKPYEFGDSTPAERELNVYTQIRQARSSQLRTSTLFGLVRDDSGFLLGLLLHYIDCKGVTLKRAVTPEVSLQ